MINSILLTAVSGILFFLFQTSTNWSSGEIIGGVCGVIGAVIAYFSAAKSAKAQAQVKTAESRIDEQTNSINLYKAETDGKINQFQAASNQQEKLFEVQMKSIDTLTDRVTELEKENKTLTTEKNDCKVAYAELKGELNVMHLFKTYVESVTESNWKHKDNIKVDKVEIDAESVKVEQTE